jgi:metallo-beta-lactamase family protein
MPTPSTSRRCRSTRRLTLPAPSIVCSRSATTVRFRFGGQIGVRRGSDPDLSPIVEFINAGHLLGSAYARVSVAGTTILFGGDLGRYGRPVLPDPSPVADADILLLESTYGDRLHEPDDRGNQLAAIVNDTATRGGKLIIPSFAIGRVEEVLYWLKRLEDEKRIPVLPCVRRQPDGRRRAAVLLRPFERAGSRAGHDLRRPSRLRVLHDADGERRLGAAVGGRVLRHLAAAISNPKTTVLFVGYQAAGTRGRKLTDGATEIKMLGHVYPVAARVERIDSMSAHADAGEIMRWLSGFSRPPRMTYLVHGEAVALAALAAKITTERQWPVHIATHREHVQLPT